MKREIKVKKQVAARVWVPFTGRVRILSVSTAWTKLEQFNGEQVARFFQVITFPQRELCARYSTMNSN